MAQCLVYIFFLDARKKNTKTVIIPNVILFRVFIHSLSLLSFNNEVFCTMAIVVGVGGCGGDDGGVAATGYRIFFIIFTPTFLFPFRYPLYRVVVVLVLILQFNFFLMYSNFSFHSMCTLYMKPVYFNVLSLLFFLYRLPANLLSIALLVSVRL